MFPCAEFWSGGFWLFPVLILGIVLMVFLLMLFGNWQNANRVFCVPFKRDKSQKMVITRAHSTFPSDVLLKEKSARKSLKKSGQSFSDTECINLFRLDDMNTPPPSKSPVKPI